MTDQTTHVQPFPRLARKLEELKSDDGVLLALVVAPFIAYPLIVRIIQMFK